MYYINGNVFQRIVSMLVFTVISPKYYSRIRTIPSKHTTEAQNTLAVQRKIEHMIASSFGTSWSLLFVLCVPYFYRLLSVFEHKEFMKSNTFNDVSLFDASFTVETLQIHQCRSKWVNMWHFGKLILVANSIPTTAKANATLFLVFNN